MSTKPYLIRGSKGLPVGVAFSPTGGGTSQSPTKTVRTGARERDGRVPSSVLKATAVRKTANTKKKKPETKRDVSDSLWRPLGAFLEGDTSKPDVAQSTKSTGQAQLLQPPRLSEEVLPVNLQNLFEDTSVNEFSKVQVYVRIRSKAGDRAVAGHGGQNHAPCLFLDGQTRLGIAPPACSANYKVAGNYVGQIGPFNRVFGPETTQGEYYSETAKVLVEQLVQRGKFEGVFLSYGITAAGKTYTIQGTKENPGIIPLALHTLFGKLTNCQRGPNKQQSTVHISYCEIYNEAIYDLLDNTSKERKPLKLMDAKDGSIAVPGLSWVRVTDAKDGLNILRQGIKLRKKATTKLNSSSSRSHSVCSIRLADADGRSRKLSFVDLAGSERAHRTGNDGSSSSLVASDLRLREAVSINGSLMTLGRCLEVLRFNQANKTGSESNMKVVPYRESKITHLFRDALHGYGNVVLSVNVSSSPSDFDETLRVLKYAVTASQISTEVKNCSTFAPVQTKGRLKSQTPLSLKRHRMLMEKGQGTSGPQQVVKPDIPEVSVSIDSRIQGASPLPQLLCEDDINKISDPSIMEMRMEEFDANVVDTRKHVASVSFSPSGMPKNDERVDGEAEQEKEEEDQVSSDLLRSKLEMAEAKLMDMEAEVREEVATEMAQIINNIEDMFKKRIHEDAKATDERIRSIEVKHSQQIAALKAENTSQRSELDELRPIVDHLEKRATKRRKKILQLEDEAQRYKDALNNALSEIEKLHVIIEQEEAANANLASSLSEILREQALPATLDGRLSDPKNPPIEQMQQHVTQIAANNAMEKDMSEHLIDRLRKDNEILRTKMSAMTHAIETCCSPSRTLMMQSLIAACSPGAGRGPAGTPHEVALARARRLMDSPVSNESPRDSPKTSRFAKEIENNNPSPKITSDDRPSNLREVRESDEVDLLTPVAPGEEPVEEGPLKEVQQTKKGPRRSPRKRKETDLQESDESYGVKGDGLLPTRVTRRNKNTKIKENLDSPPPSAQKPRKLLSTTKNQLRSNKQTPVRILGVSNSAKKSQRRGGLPTAEELGLKS
jgi:hypothetical protein